MTSGFKMPPLGISMKPPSSRAQARISAMGVLGLALAGEGA
jgi:hypothetical protein